MNTHDLPTSPDELRDRLFAQDPALLNASNRLANTIRAVPVDPEHPDTEPRALLVGGFVRDAVLGKQPKDADLEVYGIAPTRLESVLEQLFPKQVNAVGKAFGVYKVALGEGLDFDISIPRRESKTGSGHKDFAIQGDPSMSIEDAARRRDFTLNALAADPLTGEIIDPFNGLDDLRKGILRVTDKERFQDDPLRVYRALQFAARMNLAMDDETKALLKEMVERGDLDHLPKERVTEEIKKLVLKSEKPSIGFEYARELGMIEREYPELHALIGVEQDPEWHPEGDVWVHTMMVMDAAANIMRQTERNFSESEQLQVMMGALAHDLGKPSTTEFKDGRWKAHGHEEAGVEPTKALFTRWAFAQEVEQASIVIAKEHLKPSMLAVDLAKGRLDDKQYTNAVRKLVRRIHPVSWRVLAAASEADARGRTTPDAQTTPYEPGQLLKKTITAQALDAEPTKSLIQGRDLAALGVKPGKDMGRLINVVEEARDRGEVTTKEDALAFVRRII